MKSLRYWRSLSTQEKNQIMKSKNIKTIQFSQIELIYKEHLNKK